MTTDSLPPLLRPVTGIHGRRRVVAAAAVALAAFAGGLVCGARETDEARAVADRWAAAWEGSDWATMHSLLTGDAAQRASLRRFARTYRDAAQALTLERVEVGRPRGASGGEVTLPASFHTRLFGVLRGEVALPVVEGDGAAAVDWRPQHVYPGLTVGEKLSLQTALPPRADLLARDGTPLAAGPARASPLGPAALEVVGTLGPAPADRAEELAAAGVPADAPVGISGLERELDERLTGRPGGVLRAGARVLERAPARPATAVRTSIAAKVQQAAVAALAGRYGAVAALRPGTGEVLALAGVALSGPQPPGSTFKIVTLAGALDAGVVRRGERFPVETSTTLEGVPLANANGEACGGTLREAFAESCNSVFAPLGVELGAGRLVAAAERFGFNEDPSLAGAAPSTLPAAEDIGDDLAVGSTAIGQGKLLATALQMASVAATIADDGVRHHPTVLRGARGDRARATEARTARTIARYMRAVVRDGTGVAAAIPGVAVAGKTGTAELRTTHPAPPLDPTASPTPAPEEDLSDTDAWFVAFAPASKPRVAVAVLLIGQGAGGATAAPAARGVLEAALP